MFVGGRRNARIVMALSVLEQDFSRRVHLRARIWQSGPTEYSHHPTDGSHHDRRREEGPRGEVPSPGARRLAGWPFAPQASRE